MVETNNKQTSALKESFKKSIDYIISLSSNPHEKSTSATLIQIAYLMAKLIDSVEYLVSKEFSAKPQSTTIPKLQRLVAQLLQAVGIMGPVLSMTLPNHPFAALMLVLGYNLNLFRKSLVVAENGIIYNTFHTLIAPVLKRLPLGNAVGISSRL